jgi:23S rRNA (cytosine1962-C5)-methyltransferase
MHSRDVPLNSISQVSSSASSPTASANLPSGWSGDDYELIDFGAGRKLERFGGLILDRPSPAAEAYVKATPTAWSSAHVRVGSDGKLATEGDVDWSGDSVPWQVRYGPIAFNLKLTPFGHVGLFPEQSENWRWLVETMGTAGGGESAQGTASTSALNLFAYTGGTTQALAAAGASVVHVDASAPAVAWARNNARTAGLQDHPIRWLVEDARKFTQRELRRGNRYDAIVLDPPSYGHGPSGKPWILGEHLPELIENCLELLRHNGKSWLLFTAHCEQPTPQQIIESLRQLRTPVTVNDGRLHLLDRQQRPLDAGFFIRAQY